MQKDDLLKWAQMSPTPVATEPNVSQSATTTMIQPADLETEVQQVVQALTSRGIDITVGYANWRNLAFALADGLGESGRSHFHALSSLHADYNYVECDKQYTACLHGRGSGITIKTFFAMAKEAGVQLRVSANSAKPPHGGNNENDEKRGILGDFTNFRQPGGMAELAELAETDVSDSSSDRMIGETFSNRLKRADLPSYLYPVIDNHPDTVACDKMLLGTLNLVSGVLPDTLYSIYDGRKVFAPLYNIIFGRFGTLKGELEACRQLLMPIKREMRCSYEAAMKEYELEKSAWEMRNKGERGPEPKEPVLSSPFVTANSSASAVYRQLDANQGWGVVFETEADTLTNMLSKNEYGDYSDLLRKAHHHETIAMVRVSDRIHIEIEKPRLSVFLTCTGSQLPLLLPASNVANGLASRFLFYALPNGKVTFHNVFAKRDCPIEEIYKAMGEQLLPLYHALQKRKNQPIQFVLSDSQQNRFVETFDGLLHEQFQMLGEGIQGFVFRLALECFRYAMILTVLRRLSDVQGRHEDDVESHLFDDDEQALICNDKDFETAMTIIHCLVNHTARVYAVIGTKEDDPFCQLGEQPNQSERKFYEALPSDRMFTTKEAKSIANQIGYPVRSAERTLGTLYLKYRVLVKVNRGQYQKVTKQDSSTV